MVHNGLIGGQDNTMVDGTSDYDLGANNASIYPDNSSEATDLLQIQSDDLIPFDVGNASELHQYGEHFLASHGDLLSELPQISVDEAGFILCNDSTQPTQFLPLQIDAFPNLEEHDHAGLKFELILNPGTGAKGNWYYSPKLRKVFIRMDQTFYMEISYLANPAYKNICLRAMMVFLDDVGLPVTRCNNHKHSDLSMEEAEKESVIRSENSDSHYYGKAIGKNVSDRLSVLFPLSVSVIPDNNRIKQNIAYKFVCQNSCIGRRPTAIIFTLENERKKILAKRVVNVKICSCPKRDKEKEEKKTSELKRTASEANLPRGKKLRIIQIKEEPDVSPSTPQSTESTADNDEEEKLEICMPNKESMDFILDSCFAQITKLMYLNPDNPKYIKYLKYYKDLIESRQQVQNT